MRVLIVGASASLAKHLVQKCTALGLTPRLIESDATNGGHVVQRTNAIDVERLAEPKPSVSAWIPLMENCSAAFFFLDRYLLKAHCERRTNRQNLLREGVKHVRAFLEACLEQHRRLPLQRIIWVSRATTLGSTFDPQSRLGSETANAGRAIAEAAKPASFDFKREVDLLDEDCFYVPGARPWPQLETLFAMEAEAYRYLVEGLPLTIALPTSMYGPDGSTSPLTDLVHRFWDGRVRAYIDGMTNMVDERDVVDGLSALLRAGRPGRRYILGGPQTQMSDVLQAASYFTSSITPPKTRLSPRIEPLLSAVREGIDTRAPKGPSLMRSWWPIAHFAPSEYCRPVSLSRAESELGYAYRSVEETLSAMWSWYRKQR